jgi:thiol-disulfide isomerase/thioredoxin
MIEFMGIGCAPCHSAIPFLKQLATEYSIKDFELVSIETWSQNSDALKRYKDNNKLNYTTLVSTNDLKKIYNAESVPVFYILDKERVIRKTIKGYGKETTAKEIRDAIKELM